MTCTHKIITTILAAWPLLGDAGAEDIGTVSMDSRLRYESANISGLEDANNASLRLRLGYATPEFKGFQGMVEGEFTTPFDRGEYNAAGVHGDRGKAVIADPESYDLDQLYLSYRSAAYTAKVGRQVIALDNQRFVGHVGWRQNRQTYDAATLTLSPVEDLKLFYGYVDNVVRIFGSKAPDTGGNAGESESESHLVNAAWKVDPTLTLSLYAYLLDLEDVPAIASSDTIGAHAKGTFHLAEGARISYLAEYAYQQDAGGNPLDYEADYLHLNVGGSYQGLMVEVGYEVLGSDDTGAIDDEGTPVFGAFQTPLATLHKFNGFADRFLVTPSRGLADTYGMVGYTFALPGRLGPLVAKLWYHDFASDEDGDDFGEEWDAVLVKPLTFEVLPGTLNALAKYADYQAGDIGADTERFSFEFNYAVTF